MDRQVALDLVSAVARAHPLWTARELADHLLQTYEVGTSRACSIAVQAKQAAEMRLREWILGRRQRQKRRCYDPNPWMENAVRFLEGG